MEEAICADPELEALNKKLNDPEERAEYARPFDNYRPAWLPRFLGGLLVWSGNFVYGKEPSYLKFRAVEVIARVPYHSWSSAAFTLLTMFYTDEMRAMELSKVSNFSRISKDNETMHVVVISMLAMKEKQAGTFRHTVIPVVFAFFYFWAAYWLYAFSPKWAFELNYLFESHAYEQYSRFLDMHGRELRGREVGSEYLRWYGRNPANQYEFFESVRNDELIHRNRSIEAIRAR